MKSAEEGGVNLQYTLGLVFQGPLLAMLWVSAEKYPDHTCSCAQELLGSRNFALNQSYGLKLQRTRL